MFESIVIRRTDSPFDVFDIGVFAEALLYYQNVHIILDDNIIKQLLGFMSLDDLIRLLKRPNVKASYYKDVTGVHQESRGGLTGFSFWNIEIIADSNKRRLSAEDLIMQCIERSTSLNKGACRRYARKIVDAIAICRYGREKLPGSELSINKCLLEELKKTQLIDNISRKIIRSLVPGSDISLDNYFRAHIYGDLIAVDSNIDFSDLSKKLKKLTGNSESEVKAENILLKINGAITDIVISSRHNSEIMTDKISSEILIEMANFSVANRKNSEDKIKFFHEFVVDDDLAIRETLNAKRRTFREFLDLLEFSEEFRSFVGRANPDIGLLKEYQKRLNQEGWGNTVAGKFLRFLACQVTGGVSEGVGALSSAFDTFFLDGLRRGWKPHQFVRKRLVPFIEG